VTVTQGLAVLVGVDVSSTSVGLASFTILVWHHIDMFADGVGRILVVLMSCIEPEGLNTVPPVIPLFFLDV